MNKKYFWGFLACALFLGSAAATSAAENKMTREEYKAQLAEFTAREAKAMAEIEHCNTQIAALQRQLSEVNAQINSKHEDLLRLVSSTDLEIDAFGSKLDNIVDQLNGLMALAPEELFHQQIELAELSQQLHDLQQSKLAALPDMAEKLTRAQNMLGDLNSRRPLQISIDYSVAKGDNLWNIAKKETIYDDPYMWPRIFRANRDQIKDPDLIYPKQVLAVPYGVGENQYLVTRGDFLTKVASEVYNDPTRWHKIYEANKDQIVEPTMIFPAMVLEIPSN
jgi:nucleoid-associated protein YgaU